MDKFHIDEPREIGRVKMRVSSTDLKKAAGVKESLTHVVQKYGLKKEGRDSGYSFNYVRQWANVHRDTKKSKVVYGTRSKKFHVIGQGDRDFNTNFAVTPKEFLTFKNEKDAIKRLTQPHMMRDSVKVPYEYVSEGMMKEDSVASAKAKKMGLKYYGFGRYGKDGTVTHKSVDGNLVKAKEEDSFPQTTAQEFASWIPGTKSHKMDKDAEQALKNALANWKKLVDKDDEELGNLSIRSISGTKSENVVREFSARKESLMLESKVEIEWFGRDAVVHNFPKNISPYDMMWACVNVEKEGDGVYRFDDVYRNTKRDFIAVVTGKKRMKNGRLVNETFRRAVMQKENDGDWTVWPVSPHTGSRQREVLFRGSKQQAAAFIRKYQRGKVGESNMTEAQTRPLHVIAQEISKDWKNVNFAARPYLDAMHSLDSTKDNYGADSGSSVVAYFLSNASTWRGPVAKRIKAELKKKLKLRENLNESDVMNEMDVTLAVIPIIGTLLGYALGGYVGIKAAAGDFDKYINKASKFISKFIVNDKALDALIDTMKKKYPKSYQRLQRSYAGPSTHLRKELGWDRRWDRLVLALQKRIREKKTESVGVVNENSLLVRKTLKPFVEYCKKNGKPMRELHGKIVVSEGNDPLMIILSRKYNELIDDIVNAVKSKHLNVKIEEKGNDVVFVAKDKNSMNKLLAVAYGITS